MATPVPCLSLSISAFFFSACLGPSLTLLPSSQFSLCKSFTAAVPPAQSLWILKWHLKPFETQPIPLPPPLSSKRNGTKWRGPALLFPSGTKEPHFGVLEVLMLDCVSSSCWAVLTSLPSAVPLLIIFSLPCISCTSKGKVLHSGMLLLLHKCAFYRRGF